MIDGWGISDHDLEQGFDDEVSMTTFSFTSQHYTDLSHGWCGSAMETVSGGSAKRCNTLKETGR